MLNDKSSTLRLLFLHNESQMNPAPVALSLFQFRNKLARVEFLKIMSLTYFAPLSEMRFLFKFKWIKVLLYINPSVRSFSKESVNLVFSKLSISRIRYPSFRIVTSYKVVSFPTPVFSLKLSSSRSSCDDLITFVRPLSVNQLFEISIFFISVFSFSL
jgi:hypothetical protein